MPTAGDRGATRADATPDVPRTLRHLDTDKEWAERDTANKVHCTAVEAAHRLRGLADVLYGEGIHNHPYTCKFSFLGAAINDIALALERATKAQWAEWEAKDRKAAKRLPAPAKAANGRAAA